MKKIIKSLAACAVFTLPVLVQAGTVEDKIKAAMEMDYRTEAEIARDANRAPVEALAFMGLKDDMTVIEYFPAGGWYTKILAPVLADKGQLYLIDSERTFSKWNELNNHPAIKKAKKINVEAAWNREGMRYDIGEIKLSVKDADLFLNIREYHNLSHEDKARLNSVAFDSLKSGGSYVIIDHSRRHMSEEDGPMFRREDAVKVILDVQAAGFVLEKYSDMFYRPDDSLQLEVGDKSVTGKTDRFFLVFKKP